MLFAQNGQSGACGIGFSQYPGPDSSLFRVVDLDYNVSSCNINQITLVTCVTRAVYSKSCPFSAVLYKPVQILRIISKTTFSLKQEVNNLN